jgi:hypothetical protein
MNIFKTIEQYEYIFSVNAKDEYMNIEHKTIELDNDVDPEMRKDPVALYKLPPLLKTPCPHVYIAHTQSEQLFHPLRLLELFC